jgi:hypothetical protein
MALVALGVAVVFIFSNIEPSGRVDDEAPKWSSVNGEDGSSQRLVKQESPR